MKKMRQTLCEKDSFQIFDILYRLRDKVHIFYPILLKFAQLVCIIARINSFENE